MGKPPNLIEGPYESPDIDHEKEMEEHGAPPTVSRAMYIVLAIVVAALLYLVVFALHKPTGG